MSDPVSEDRVKTILGDKLDPIKEDITTLKLDKEKILGKLDAIYGNGSGRKGILERMEDKQKEDTLAVRTELATTTNLLKEESIKQTTFRDDMRVMLETIQLSDAARQATEKAKEEAAKEKAKTNNSWRTWVKYGIVTVAGIAWELYKTFHEKAIK